MVPPGGVHVLIDIRDIVDRELLKDSKALEILLSDAARSSNATILNSYFHHFGEEYGVTGIIALAESHISIHTWPDEGYAAIDIFMCGNCDVSLAEKHILTNIKGELSVKRILRQ